VRLAFLGSPAAACPALTALLDAGHEIAVVISAPDKRRGRGSVTSPTPVAALARSRGLAVAHDLTALTSSGATLGVVVAFGQLIPARVLDALPMCNVHFSLLPRWRGAAPVERAILAGDARTGVCVMALEETLDTGPIYARASTEVDDKTAAALTAELADLGASLLVAVLAGGLTDAHSQIGDATYAKKLRASELVLVPTQTVAHLSRVVRVGGAVCAVEGQRLRVDAAAVSSVHGTVGSVSFSGSEVLLHAADGALALQRVTPAGAATMDAASWWRGKRPVGALRWSGLTESTT
jgi:methionyl-tRNA formyltransferase